MKTIWKFPVQIGPPFKVDMPHGAEILAVQNQWGAPQMWALVDTERPLMTETFYIVGTGGDVGDAEAIYCGTFQDGPFVWHLFKQ